MSTPEAQTTSASSSPDSSVSTPSAGDGSQTAAGGTSDATNHTPPEKTTTGSRATRVVSINTKRGPVNFEARTKEPSSDSKPGSQSPEVRASSASAATGGQTTTAAAAEQTKEPPKPADPPPHRALTVALEKEAKLVEERKAFKAEREAFEAHKAAIDSDVAALQKGRALVKEGKRLQAVADLLGLSLDDLQDEFLSSIKEETPEDKAARIVRETLAKERETAAQKAREAEEAATAERTAQEQQRVDWWKNQAQEAYKARVAEFDPAAFEGVTADQVWQRAMAECNATSKLPTASEALDLIQKDFDARLAKSKRYRPAETPPAATESKDSPKAKDTPKTLTARGAGSVPITVKTVTKKLTAQERAREAMRELGVKD